MTLNQGLTYSMPLEVYLHAAVVRGVLVTNQSRLSNYLVLREGEEVFSLKEATLESTDRKPIAVASDEYLVYMREVYLIADLSPTSQTERTGKESFYVNKESSKALFSVGPYLLRGSIHLLPGAALHDLLVDKSQFIPVTDAILLNCQEVPPRTYLVNRDRLGFMTAVDDGLVEFWIIPMATAVPTEINHIKSRGAVRITWDDGHVGEYAQEYLRGYCPCAMCQGHGAQQRFIAVPGAVLAGMRGVGNYAIELIWQDGHSTGIYSFEYLRSLCPCTDCTVPRQTEKV